MDVNAKSSNLRKLYQSYESHVTEYKAAALCRVGCAYCCTHYGTVDMTTLEGWLIFQWIEGLATPLRQAMRKRIRKNMIRKENGEAPRCPFLAVDDTCRIYDLRPFSCRQLYSISECARGGPAVHRRDLELARETVLKIQQLDDTGYSGHMTYILHLLGDEGFRDRYLAGGFDPAEIMAFGKAHRIIINRLTAP